MWTSSLGETLGQVPCGCRLSLPADLPGNATWMGRCKNDFVTFNHADQYAHICNTLLSRQLTRPPNPSFTSFICHLALRLCAPAFFSLWLGDNLNLDERLFVSDMGEPVSFVDWNVASQKRGPPPRGPKVGYKV